MNRVVILGANSLIGQHLYGALLSKKVRQINVWELREPFSYRIEDISDADSKTVASYIGMNELRSAIDGCDTVFNLYEIQDFTIKPDVDKLKEHNVDFVKKVLDYCEECHVKKLIQLSSVYLQSSAKWPNILCREETDYEKFRKEVPFPAYCDSKHAAEQLIQKATGIRSVCARVGAVYGEGDRRSVICDKILLSKFYPSLPRIGDKNGVFQLTYAGNAAFALLKCAEKLDQQNDDRDGAMGQEMVLISDDTPVKHVNVIAQQMLDDKYKEPTDTTGISFYVFYPLYRMFCMFVWLWTVFYDKSSLKLIPSPPFLYMTIHHWTFYSDYKLRIFFDYSPHFRYEKSLLRSSKYYRQMDPESIAKFSWMPDDC